MSSQGVPPDQPPRPGGQPAVPGGGQGPAGNPSQGAPRGDPQSGGASQGFPPSDPTQGYAQQGDGEPPRKSRAWLWVVLVVLVAAGVAAGIIASENKSSPETVINQQTTSTVNSLGVTVQAPPAQKTVSTPTQTVTAPPKTVTTPPQTVTTPILPATTPKTTTTGATP